MSLLTIILALAAAPFIILTVIIFIKVMILLLALTGVAIYGVVYYLRRGGW